MIDPSLEANQKESLVHRSNRGCTCVCSGVAH